MTDDQPTLDNLPAVRYSEAFLLHVDGVPMLPVDFVHCDRCGALLQTGLEYQKTHGRWHAAIEAATTGFTITTSGGRRVEITDQFLAEAILAAEITAVFYLVTCQDCQDRPNLPFEDRAARDKWSKAHTDALGHRVEHHTEIRSQRPTKVYGTFSLADVSITGPAVDPEALKRLQGLEDVTVEINGTYDAAPCLRLYLHGGTLINCNNNPRRPHTVHQHLFADGEVWQWTDSQGIPVPWPVEQKPPAGIDVLTDNDPDPAAARYLCRVADGSWTWLEDPASRGNIIHGMAWPVVAVAAEGELCVVRP